ncbi:MAG: hypothetical protein JNM52_11805 [Betaproteobacteria bacterium]|nr:hypothetical protein [Betaproteobacteria bacterium]
MPFYSDAQRKWFFANIAPMEKWGLGHLPHLAHDPFGEIKRVGMYALSSAVMDSLGKAFGWKEVTDQETLKKLQSTITGEDYRAVLSADEMGKLQKVETSELQKKWAKLAAKNIGANEQVKKFVLDHATTFLNNDELNIAHVTEGFHVVSSVHPTPHTGIDIGTYGNKGVDYHEPCDGIVLKTKDDLDKKKGYGKYHEMLCGQDGQFFMLRTGHFEERDDQVLQEGNWVKAGTKSAVIGSTGHSTAPHVDIKKVPAHLDYQAIHDKSYDCSVELPEKVAQALTETQVAKEGKLTYQKGKLTLKGYMTDAAEIQKLRQKSSALNQALDSLAQQPIEEKKAALQKLTLQDAHDIQQGKKPGWTLSWARRTDGSYAYVSPADEAKKIVQSIYQQEIPKRSDEIIKKVSAKAAKEFSTWILSSKVEKKKAAGKKSSTTKTSKGKKSTAPATKGGKKKGGKTGQ